MLIFSNYAARKLSGEFFGRTADGTLVLRALKAQAVGELLGDPVWEASLLRVVSAEVLDYLIRYTWNQDVDKEGFRLRFEVLRCFRWVAEVKKRRDTRKAVS